MLQVERKTNIISLTAFLLSVVSISYSFFGFLKGSAVDLLPMKQVTLFVEQEANGAETLRIAAPMTYVNTGFSGYDDVIVEEYVEFELGDHTYRHDWQYFGSFETENGNFKRVSKGSALPFVINGGSATSKETMFAYHPVDCSEPDLDCIWANRITPTDFVNQAVESGRVEFKFTGRLSSGGRQITRCVIRPGAELVDALLFTSSKAAGPVCVKR